nr:transposase [Bacteroidaceae bacterium]
MKKSRVTVIFDRKKRVAKKGKGFVELRIYLNHDVRKFITLGEITPDEWEGYAELPSVKEEVSRYENILQAMEILGTPLTVENLNKALGKEPEPKMVESPTSSERGDFIA